MLGEVHEPNTLGDSTTRSHRLRFDGRSGVRCWVDSDDAPELRYVGLSVRRERLLEGVFLPNATPVADVPHELDASCDAELLGERDAAEVARGLAVSVKVKVRGFEPLRFPWRAGDAPTRRVLVPKN